MSLCERPSANRSDSPLIMLRKPGAITCPWTSRSVLPWAPPKSPTAAIVSPLMATPPAVHGAPLPSQTRPFRRTTSYRGARVHALIRAPAANAAAVRTRRFNGPPLCGRPLIIPHGCARDLNATGNRRWGYLVEIPYRHRGSKTSRGIWACQSATDDEQVAEDRLSRSERLFPPRPIHSSGLSVATVAALS